jgi:hypothetical protein
MYLQKVINQKNWVNLFCAGLLKLNDENSMIRIQTPDPISQQHGSKDPNPGQALNVMEPEHC